MSGSKKAAKTPPEVSEKIRKLIQEEGKTPKEAAGQAYGMYREGRLPKRRR